MGQNLRVSFILRVLVSLYNEITAFCYFLEDAVMLASEAEREEYVLNESGIIWAGAHNDMFTWPWNFAQVSSITRLKASL